MRKQDDTVATNRQAHEDTILAMAEAGQFPGVSCHEMGKVPAEVITPNAMLLHRVLRWQAEGGGHSGARMALMLLRDTPEAAEGRLMLSFDGWADDPRELAQIPCVVEFCQGMLLGVGEEPNMGWAKNVLGLFLDERTTGLPMQEMAEIPGALWLVAHAHAGVVFAPSQGRMMRDMNLNALLLDNLTRG